MNGDLLNAIPNTSNSDQQEYEEIINKLAGIEETYLVTADEITAVRKREEREMSMDILEKIDICIKGHCDKCEFNELRKSSISGSVFCMEKLMNEAKEEIKRLKEKLNEK